MPKKTLRVSALVAFALIAAVVVASCSGDDAATQELPPASPDRTTAATEPTEAPQIEPRTARNGDEQLAPELVGISSWINSEPLTLEQLRGSVVLIDFWTYTCVNCIRTFPFLKDWHAKYADKGLVIVGVHSPEFKFEKIRRNVIDATVREGIEWPVAQDNEFQTWRVYKNNFWPAKYLVDKDGYIRYTHFGEGAYAETEQQIRDLLGEAGASLSDISVKAKPERAIDFRAYSADAATRITRELYAGVDRNYAKVLQRQAPPYVAHQEYYDGPDREIDYEDPGEHVNQFIYLHGLWRNGSENLVHARETQNYEDYIAIMSYSTSVNVVLSLEDGEPYDVRVTFDDRPLRPSEAGADVMFDGEGNSFVRVTESRMYRVVETPEYGGHEVKLSSNSSKFSVFAYTFGAFTD